MHTGATASAVAAAPQPVKEWTRRIHAEYREMPGLCLTVPQAARLFGLDPATLTTALGPLVESRFLARTRDGAYVKAETY
jgi:hypothetical protein